MATTTHPPAPRSPLPASSSDYPHPPRTLRGLVFGFVLSAVNLVGAFLTIAALGGLGPWSTWQFIGLFAVMEIATGIGFILGPNIWKLPVVQGETDGPVHLAATSILKPHWAAGAKTLAGIALLAGTAYHEAIGPETLGVVPLVLGILAAVIGLSLIAARLGVARPDIDVYGFTVRRPRREDKALPGFSLGASVVQLLINIGTFPAVKLLGPEVLYQPALGPSLELMIAVVATGAVALITGFACWSGRLRLRAHRHQAIAEETVDREPAPTGG